MSAPVQNRSSRRLLALFPVAALLISGLGMPGCPGSEAMQQQVDALNQKAGGHDKQLQTVNAQITQISKDLAEARTLLAQVSETVLAQKQALDGLRGSLQEMAEKLAKPAAAKKKGK